MRRIHDGERRRSLGCLPQPVCFATGACTAFWLGAQAADALPEGVQVIVYSKHAAQSGWDVLEGEPCLAEQWAEDGALSLIFENEDTMIFRAA